MVTPSYNQAEYLEEAIRSVLLQGYPNLEYIVVDGGSTDGSVKIIRRYEHWISRWISEPDQGQSHAIHKGFERGTGEVLAWLNSDDRLRPGVLFAAAGAFGENPRAGLIYGRSAICDERGDTSERLLGTEFSLPDMLRGVNCVSQPSAFFSREAYEAVGGLNQSLHYVMDMDLWVRIASRFQAVFRDETWSDFRIHPSSKTGRRSIGFLEETLEIIERAFSTLPIPASIAARRGAILARLMLKLAFAYYQRSESDRARGYAARALRLDPALVKHPEERRVLLRCLAGRGFILGFKRLLGRQDDER